METSILKHIIKSEFLTFITIENPQDHAKSYLICFTEFTIWIYCLDTVNGWTALIKSICIYTNENKLEQYFPTYSYNVNLRQMVGCSARPADGINNPHIYNLYVGYKLERYDTEQLLLKICIQIIPHSW